MSPLNFTLAKKLAPHAVRLSLTRPPPGRSVREIVLVRRHGLFVHVAPTGMIFAPGRGASGYVLRLLNHQLVHRRKCVGVLRLENVPAIKIGDLGVWKPRTILCDHGIVDVEP